jgi:atlastin
MSNEHRFGKALNIIQFSEGNLQCDESSLDNLLLNSQVKSRKIVVFTIVGAFRRGKSFFLDYCLRFMYANVSFLFNYF